MAGTKSTLDFDFFSVASLPGLPLLPSSASSATACIDRALRGPHKGGLTNYYTITNTLIYQLNRSCWAMHMSRRGSPSV